MQKEVKLQNEITILVARAAIFLDMYYLNISADFELNGTVEIHNQNKDPKHPTLLPPYPCTLEVGHQNCCCSLFSIKSEYKALHLVSK